MAHLKIKVRRKQARPFKKHLEKEHPMTRGNIEIESNKCPRKRSKTFGTAKQVKALTKSSPDFMKIARQTIRL